MALGRFPTLTGHMYSDVLYSFTIGFVGAILFLLVDKYEPEGPLARLLKFLILFVAGVAILHKLQPYGLVGVGRAHNDPLVIASFCGSDLQRNAP
jgi:hypothetical protein